MQKNYPKSMAMPLATFTACIRSGLTVGAQTESFQQLGLRRSWPVYLSLHQLKYLTAWLYCAHQVMVTFSGFPKPFKPLRTFVMGYKIDLSFEIDFVGLWTLVGLGPYL